MLPSAPNHCADDFDFIPFCHFSKKGMKKALASLPDHDAGGYNFIPFGRFSKKSMKWEWECTREHAPQTKKSYFFPKKQKKV